MSGKAYTMREMKTIVEYLTEHKAYSETRGRKMWMDFAASRLTNRTWQSLKECFIKRILPDITNPYFKLDLEQIHSFKRGLDLTQKNKNKLELKPVDQQKEHNDENGDVGQPSTSKANNEDNSTGGSHSKRLNGRKRTTSHRKHHYESSESSEWTSASDSEYVSPPRGRRNRYARKYLKPHSARIRCLEDEGGLFVMLGKKIYPFVRDGKIIKSYVTYASESDPEDEDSYWKSKYVEEKKRNAELKKMVSQTKQNGVISKESSVSITPPPKNHQQPTSRRESAKRQELVAKRESESMERNGQEKTVKIKFTKFDQEVQLEGHWQHLNPVLAQVVSMLKEPVKPPETVNCVEISSGNTTPSRNLALDSGVQEKINKIESEIFKEIIEMDENDKKEVPKEQEDNVEVKLNGAANENEVEQSKVTVRKKVGRPKRNEALVPSPVKPKATSEPAKSKDVERVKEQEIADSTLDVATTRRSRTPRKLLDVPNETASTSNKNSPKKKSPSKEDPNNEDEEIRYKFPSPPPEKRRRKSTNIAKKTKTSNK